MGALCTPSGQAANLIAMLTIFENLAIIWISIGTIYGSNCQPLAVDLRRFGIEVTFVDAGCAGRGDRKAFRPNTKVVFGETIANPSIAVLDIEKDG